MNAGSAVPPFPTEGEGEGETATAVVVSVATMDGHEMWMSMYSSHADTLAAPFVYTVNAVRWSAGWSVSPFEYAK